MGSDIPELETLQEQINRVLETRPEFRGLRPEGFTFKIFTRKEARRLFSGEEIYFIGGGP
jgi:hypothetical protein